MTEETAAKVSRRPTITVNGESYPALKWPFPVKAPRFPVTVNGQAAVAACTTGKDKHYTYILFNNTSFYVPGILPVDSAVAINFPEDYKFDDEVQKRISNYKPKKKAKAKAEGDPETEEAEEAEEEQAEEPAPAEEKPAQPEVSHQAKRRGKAHASGLAGAGEPSA